MASLVPVYSGESGVGSNPSRYALQIPGVGPLHLVENTIGNEDSINPPIVELPVAEPVDNGNADAQIVPVFTGAIGQSNSSGLHALRVPGVGPFQLVENTLFEAEADEEVEPLPTIEESVAKERFELVPLYSGESGNGGIPTQYALQVPGVGPLQLVENTLFETEPDEVGAIAPPAEETVANELTKFELIPIFSGETGNDSAPTRYALRVPNTGPLRLVENTLFEVEADEEVELPSLEETAASEPLELELIPLYSGTVGNGGNPTRYALRIPGVGPLRLVENTLFATESDEPIELLIPDEEIAVNEPVKFELVPIFSGEIGELTSPTQYALRVPGVGPIRLFENTLPIVFTRTIRRTTDGRIRRTTTGKIRSVHD